MGKSSPFITVEPLCGREYQKIYGGGRGTGVERSLVAVTVSLAQSERRRVLGLPSVRCRCHSWQAGSYREMVIILSVGLHSRCPVKGLRRSGSRRYARLPGRDCRCAAVRRRAAPGLRSSVLRRTDARPRCDRPRRIPGPRRTTGGADRVPDRG